MGRQLNEIRKTRSKQNESIDKQKETVIRNQILEPRNPLTDLMPCARHSFGIPGHPWVESQRREKDILYK